MKYLFNLFVTVFFILLISVIHPVYSGGEDIPLKNHPPTDLIDDWQLTMQLWTFNQLSFFAAVDSSADLGVTWIEAYPGQKLYADDDEVVFDHNLSAEHRNIIKAKLRQKGMRLINYGVVDLPGDSIECRKIFDFAKDMGVKTLVAEPEMKYLGMIDHLCQEYDINVAIHNHPKPSRYWNPDTVLKACEGRSRYIGACVDLGHWIRSGVNTFPEIQKIGKRLTTVHMKDVADYKNPKASDVIFGKGLAEIDKVIEEFRNSKFKGTLVIEYERQTKQLMKDLRQNISAYFMIASAIRKPDWYLLLGDNLDTAVMNKDSWEMKDGHLTAKGGGDLWTKEVFGNFILDLEFKLAPGTNSGIFVRTGSIEEWLNTAIEVQILDSYGKEVPDRQDCGAIFDCLAPVKNMVLEAGEWNRYTITCSGNKIYVVLNGTQVIDMDLDKWTEAGKNPDGTNNKFTTAYKDMSRVGHIGFQYHGHPVWFRNIRIRPLELTATGR